MNSKHDWWTIIPLAGIVAAMVFGCCKDGESEIPPVRDVERGERMEYVRFDGHEYVIFHDGHGEYAVGGITHSPKCSCTGMGSGADYTIR